MFVLLLLFAYTGLAQQKIPDAERVLFESANRERAARELLLVKWDEALARAAHKHAELMAEQFLVRHQLPGEPDLASRAGEAGAKFSRVTENIGRAASASEFHDGWMHSAGHRANILDAEVDSIGIAVVEGMGQLFAVEDFSRAVKPLSFEEQEKKVAELLAGRGLHLRTIGADARKSCELESGWAGNSTPRYVVHYETGSISELPEVLEMQIRLHSYSSAAVGACPRKQLSGFTGFRLVVLLY